MWTILVVLLILWLLGFIGHFGGNLIHTQEFLSSMLGVRREGVNKAAGKLQQRQLISYTRGTLTILKPASLAAVACKCYRIIKKEYDSALP